MPGLEGELADREGSYDREDGPASRGSSSAFRRFRIACIAAAGLPAGPGVTVDVGVVPSNDAVGRFMLGLNVIEECDILS